MSTLKGNMYIEASLPDILAKRKHPAYYHLTSRSRPRSRDPKLFHDEWSPFASRYYPVFKGVVEGEHE